VGHAGGRAWDRVRPLQGQGRVRAVVADAAAQHDACVRCLTVLVDLGLVVKPRTTYASRSRAGRPGDELDAEGARPVYQRRITSDTWGTYPIFRFSEAPEISVELVGTPGAPSVGAGEAPTGPRPRPSRTRSPQPSGCVYDPARPKEGHHWTATCRVFGELS
jgi:hypothetical protein